MAREYHYGVCMSFWKTKTKGYAPSGKDEELRSKAYKRVAKMNTAQLLDWADAAGSGMAKGFDDYREYHDIESIEEIGLALFTLEAVIFELKLRATA